MERCLRDAVVVIVGASSGIGRAAALAFARRGAIVVVAARNEQALDEVAAQCASISGRALAVPTDVRDEAAVRELARTVCENFGKIDVWINNASVLLYARAEEAPYETYRQVIETNLLGVVHGVRAVLPIFRMQGRGVLIDTSSVIGRVGYPKASAYVLSKFGIIGLDMCLRQELMDMRDIHVCTLLPSTIDTPVYQRAGNYTGRAAQPVRPVYAAERVAEGMVSLALRPRRMKIVGGIGRLLVLSQRFLPGLTESLLGHHVRHAGFQDRATPPTDGNIHTHTQLWSGSITGGWRPTSGLSRLAELTRVGAHLALEIPAVLLGRISQRIRK